MSSWEGDVVADHFRITCSDIDVSADHCRSSGAESDATREKKDDGEGLSIGINPIPPIQTDYIDVFDAEVSRYRFRLGTAFSSELYYSAIAHGCKTKTKLCLCVTSGDSEWQLKPVSVEHLHYLGHELQTHLHELGDTRTRDSINWLASTPTNVSFEDRQLVEDVVKHLNIVVDDPAVAKLNCILEFMDISPVTPGGAMSASFDKNGKRRSIREGGVVLTNRNITMIRCRRAGALCSAFAIVTALAEILGDQFEISRWAFMLSGIALFVVIQVSFNLCCKRMPLCGVSVNFDVWLVLTSESISFYYEHQHVTEGPPEAAIFILPGFHIIRGADEKWVGWLETCSRTHTITVKSIDDEFKLRFASALNMDTWCSAIQSAMRMRGLQDPQAKFLANAAPSCQSLDAFDCGSFAPVQRGCQASWFVDGEGYFKSCKAAIEGAQECIYITDWMFSAEVLLDRPSVEDLQTEGRSLEPEVGGRDNRLTVAALLLKKAKDGVQVRVMIFKELAISLPNNSAYATNQLIKHRNVKVLRHDQGHHILWSHHEKLVIVDHDIAYIGGIDLAFGRYDTRAHPIKDDTRRFTPGKDLYNPRIQAQADVHEPHSDLFDRRTLPRMPWHDVTFCVSGRAARDAAKHFIQRWDNHEKSQPYETLETDETSTLRKHVNENDQQANDCFHCSRHYCSICGSCFTATRERLYCCEPIDEATYNEVLMITQNNQPSRPIPAMDEPWQSFPVRAQVLRSASDWSVGHKEIGWHENSIYQAYLYEILHAERYIHIENQFFISSTANPSPIGAGADYLSHFVDNLESAFDGYIGTDHVENQIAVALVRRISKAIYAKKAYEDWLVHKEGHEPDDDGTFRVVLMIPNFPEGSVTDASVMVVLHYTLMTLYGVDVPAHWMSKADSWDVDPVGSLIKLCQNCCGVVLGDASRWTEFISVNCLRNHDVFNGIPVMNQIYVHAKLMIVDDRVCICGSANINERSQLGTRDSEVCYRILPHERGDITIMMNGKPHKASSFAHSLRRSLWAEHLGIEDAMAVPTRTNLGCSFLADELGDPVCNKNFTDLWVKTAARNTAICDKYFVEQPANHHTTMELYRRCREVADYEISGDKEKLQKALWALEAAQKAYPNKIVPQPIRGDRVEALKSIQGHLYQYPLEFLKEDLAKGKLQPSVGDAEGMLPFKTFT